MKDPRISIVWKRLEEVKEIIAVSGGKGGVGKSIVSSMLALSLRHRFRVGLLDLDLSASTDHVILGVEGIMPKEDKGIIPVDFKGISFMSIALYNRDRPLPLRGKDVTNAIREILSITRWQNLDYLIVDMPPGIGDEFFDVVELLPGVKFLLVTVPSKLSMEIVRKLALLLREMNIPILGIIENMCSNDSYVEEECRKIGVEFLGKVRFDRELEGKIGSVEDLQESHVFKDIKRIAERVVS